MSITFETESTHMLIEADFARRLKRQHWPDRQHWSHRSIHMSSSIFLENSLRICMHAKQRI